MKHVQLFKLFSWFSSLFYYVFYNKYGHFVMMGHPSCLNLSISTSFLERYVPTRSDFSKSVLLYVVVEDEVFLCKTPSGTFTGMFVREISIIVFICGFGVSGSLK